MAGRSLLAALFIFLGTAHIGAADDDAQWIVVTAPAFKDALAPLVAQRRNDGLRVHVVQTTDVLTARQIAAGDAGPLREHIHKLCRPGKGAHYVLLVGALAAADPRQAEKTVVPALVGTIGRMKGQPSDNAFGCLDKKDHLPTLAVGRFPARSEAEAKLMVQKTLAFERARPPALWRSRLTLLVGNPGGRNALEKQFATTIVQNAASTRFDRLDPNWTGQIIIHAPESPYCVPDDQLRKVSLRYLQDGQLFSFYLGHSHAAGLWSEGAPFLERDEWAKLKIAAGPGVFFSCGCFGCQLAGKEGEGYGLIAMRNPAGPVAVLGAHGESYAAMGQLALDGLLNGLARSEPPARLADYWLAAKTGLASGKIDRFTFMLYDQADGSRGQVPIETQRLEHLEMWLLLGDPALRLPVVVPSIRLTTVANAAPGKTITVSGTLPDGLRETKVRLTLERPVGSRPPGLEPVPKEAVAAHKAMMGNHARANDVVLQAHELEPRAGRFECTVKLPAEVPWPRLIVRAVAASKTDLAVGAVKLPISK